MRKLFSVFVTLVLLTFCTCLFSSVQVGEPVVEKFQAPLNYKAGSGLVYERMIHHPNAGYISIHFSKFNLAPGDFLVISSPDGSRSYMYEGKGKVTADGSRISDFWATHIPGDSAKLELFSYNTKGKSQFVIDRWVRGFDPQLIDSLLSTLDDPGTEAICTNDDKEWAKCYEGTTMYNESKAVCRLLINGSSACTGWLLGSEGHIMTNNHCIDSQSDASNTDYEFMAEGATCSTSCSGWMDCPGTVEASSGTLVQTDSALDYSLILLPTNLTSTYGYMQLRDTLPTIGERIYIPQHPGAKGKQLAVNSDVDGGYCEVYSTSQTPCSGGPGDIGYYADTEGGSSGSPVLAYSDHLVVALHHCANCPNRGVPIPSIISDLGSNLPANAVGGSINPPVADFSADDTTIMAGDTVNFTDLSSNNPTSWSWTFNGGTPSSSTAQNPSVTYNTAGTYTVSLTATNAGGSDTETKTNYITVTALQAPVADFTASATTISEGQSVTFTDTSTGNPDTWSWTFNGGTPSSSTAQNPTITYNTAGTYTVSLTASNAAGSDTETKTDYITVTEVQPTVGNTSVYSSTSTSGNRRAMPFTMPEDGTISSVTMYHDGGSGNMILAVYDGEGSPANRIAVTASTAVSGSTGWQTINLTSPVYVASGATVWLAWVYESNPGIRYTTGSPGRVDAGEGWSGGMPDPYGSGTQADYLYSIYATYTPGGGPVQYTLTTNTVGQGSITLDPAGGVYDEGTVVTLTADPDSGWQFDNWSGDLSGSTNPTTITMNENKSVTANFSEIGTTNTVGNTSVFSSTTTTANRRAMPFTMPENGTISSVTMYHVGGSGNMILGVYDGEGSPANRLAVTPETAVSGSTGWQTINLTSPVYAASGSTVWLAWVYESNPGIAYQSGSPGRADAGVGWSGGMPDPYGSSTQASYIYSIYATYTPGGTPPQYTLTTNTVGQGSITLDPAGGTYDQGTVVTLTADPDTGWQFDVWSGDLSGSTNPTTITMNENKSVTATFSEIGTTATVGNTEVYSSTSVSGNRRAMPFTMPENGTITSVTMYHDGGSGNMILAVYDGTGSPDNRIAITAETAVSGTTGWQTINLTSPVYVTSGSTVWLAWVYESNPGIRYTTGSPGRVDAGEGWSGGMPDPYGSGTQANYLYSIYATYNVGSSAAAAAAQKE